MDNGTPCLCPWVRMDDKGTVYAMGYDRVTYAGEESGLAATRYHYVTDAGEHFYTLEPLPLADTLAMVTARCHKTYCERPATTDEGLCARHYASYASMLAELAAGVQS